MEADFIEIVNEEQKENDDEVQTKVPIVFPSKDALIVGDDENDCLFLDSDLNRGFSYKSETFDSPSFVNSKDGQFQVSQVEVWCVD